MSRLLLPLLSTIVAIIVAVGAVLIGMRFAAPEELAVPIGSEIVPVLEPVAVGDTAPPTEADDGSYVTSPAVAEREVRVPLEASTELEPGLVDLIDALTEAPDPAAALMVLDGEAETDESGVDDDPCAPRRGDPPADCPEGAGSTVLPIIGLSDFGVLGQAFPPTTEEYRVSGNRFGGVLWCDGLTVGDGQVPFGILASAPGTFSVEYWPTDRPGESTVVSGVTTAPADEAEFLAALETAASALDIPQPRQCLVLDSLQPDTAYTAIVRGTDIYDREAPPHTVRFHSEGAPVHPGAQIMTVGENLIFVSALHPDDQTVGIRASVISGAGVADCSTFGEWLEPLTTTDVAATRDQINAQRALPDFTQRSVVTFQVPEGSTVVVCARWFVADAPSWERDAPVFESSAVLQSPDRLLPVVTLEALDGAAEADVERVLVDVSSRAGTACNERTAVGISRPLPVTLCESANGLTGVRVAGDRLWDVGFDGDLVVTLEPVLSTGESAATRYLIPARDGGCRGECVAPPTAWYTVALDAVRQNTGLCGSFFGSDCTPPSRKVAVGTAQLAVRWEQGATNGQSDWNITPTVDVPVTIEPADLPQVDIDNQWSFTEPTQFSPAVTGSILIEVDRPVSYTLRLGPEDAVPAACGRDGLLQVSGRIESSATVQMPGICVGYRYFAELELVDDEGRRIVWGLTDRSAWWGYGASVRAPKLDVTLTYDFTAQHASYSRFGIGMRIDGFDLGIVDERSGSCTVDGIVVSSGSVAMGISAVQTVELRISMRTANRTAEGGCRDYRERPEDSPIRIATVTVAMADLFRPEGAVITIPDAFNTRVVLRAGVR